MKKIPLKYTVLAKLPKGWFIVAEMADESMAVATAQHYVCSEYSEQAQVWAWWDRKEALCIKNIYHRDA